MGRAGVPGSSQGHGGACTRMCVCVCVSSWARLYSAQGSISKWPGHQNTIGMSKGDACVPQSTHQGRQECWARQKGWV